MKGRPQKEPEHHMNQLRMCSHESRPRGGAYQPPAPGGGAPRGPRLEEIGGQTEEQETGTLDEDPKEDRVQKKPGNG
ncbi:hypothetical protein GCK72_002721 [Caenorhabditis remanei]|uniref:Uncharacterized protein n=2 Tax=Caenorhabditis remanei TaxID=31234 RepID=A0A6A5HWW9_CAERE|nr:hypothetical protein GCK72_002721 [Caenorhabditis remanei]KAF1770897.1 hypothetical protein GCK72_002721 [Caenorhabditis remanei]